MTNNTKEGGSDYCKMCADKHKKYSTQPECHTCSVAPPSLSIVGSEIVESYLLADMFRDGMSGRIDPSGLFHIMNLKNLTPDEQLMLLSITKDMMIVEQKTSTKQP